MFSEEYMGEEVVIGIKQLVHSGCEESNNENTCSVEDRELNV